jgi:hypothetical protein
MHMNRLRRTVGHLWQERFYSGALEDRTIWTALRYVELNPVPSVSRSPEEWRWSSARAHLGLGDALGILDTTGWRAEFDVNRWRQWLTLSSMADVAYADA